MWSKANIIFVIVFYIFGKVTLSSCEVVSVNRNVVDSFLVGENGCTNDPTVCTTRSATCQPDGWCLCSSLRSTFWNPEIKIGYVNFDGCASNDLMRAGVGNDYSPFSFEVISSSINDTATFYLDGEGIKNTSACSWSGVWAKFPNNATEIWLRWIWNWTIELINSKKKVYFKWKANFHQLQSALIKIRVTCDFDSGRNDYYLRAKVLGTWSKVTCSVADWSSSFDRKGWSKCDKNNHFITALYRSDPDDQIENPVSLIDKARCCGASAAFKDEEVDCHEICWTEKPNKRHWVRCQGGYFLSGLYRNENQSLSDIDCGYCCKPKNYRYRDEECYPQYGDPFTKAGWLGCVSNRYYVTGFIRGNYTDTPADLDWLTLRCCQIAREDVSQSTTPVTISIRNTTSKTTPEFDHSSITETTVQTTKKPNYVSRSTTPAVIPTRNTTSKTATEFDHSSLNEENPNNLNQMYYALLAVAFVVIVALAIIVGLLWKKLKRTQEELKKLKEKENIEGQKASLGTDFALYETATFSRGYNNDAFRPQHIGHNGGSSVDYEEVSDYQSLKKDGLEDEMDENRYQSLTTTTENKELQV